MYSYSICRVMKLLHKLFNAEQIIIILSIVAFSPSALGFTKSMGIQLIRIEYLCLVAPITLSMCIWTFAS